VTVFGYDRGQETAPSEMIHARDRASIGTHPCYKPVLARS
jgi:hypothetical protein